MQQTILSPIQYKYVGTVANHRLRDLPPDFHPAKWFGWPYPAIYYRPIPRSKTGTYPVIWDVWVQVSHGGVPDSSILEWQRLVNPQFYNDALSNMINSPSKRNEKP